MENKKAAKKDEFVYVRQSLETESAELSDLQGFYMGETEQFLLVQDIYL